VDGHQGQPRQYRLSSRSTNKDKSSALPKASVTHPKERLVQNVSSTHASYTVIQQEGSLPLVPLIHGTLVDQPGERPSTTRECKICMSGFTSANTGSLGLPCSHEFSYCRGCQLQWVAAGLNRNSIFCLEQHCEESIPVQTIISIVPELRAFDPSWTFLLDYYIKRNQSPPEDLQERQQEASATLSTLYGLGSRLLILDFRELEDSCFIGSTCEEVPKSELQNHPRKRRMQPHDVCVYP